MSHGVWHVNQTKISWPECSLRVHHNLPILHKLHVTTSNTKIHYVLSLNHPRYSKKDFVNHPPKQKPAKFLQTSGQHSQKKTRFREGNSQNRSVPSHSQEQSLECPDISTPQEQTRRKTPRTRRPLICFW